MKNNSQKQLFQSDKQEPQRARARGSLPRARAGAETHLLPGQDVHVVHVQYDTGYIETTESCLLFFSFPNGTFHCDYSVLSPLQFTECTTVVKHNHFASLDLIGPKELHLRGSVPESQTG